MQASPTLFTQNKKPMGFYLPPGDRKAEMISRIEEHGGQVNSKWGKDLIVLVPPDYYGKAPPGAEVYSFDYVLASIRKNSLQAPPTAHVTSPLESYRVQVPPSPAPAAKTKTKPTAPATTTAASKTTATSVSPPEAKAYTKEEDETIKRYVDKLSLAFSPTGTTIWLEMEKSKVVPGRTWQSLKDRYLKRILPVEEALGSLSAATSTSSSSTSSALAAPKASPPRPSTSGSRRVSAVHDSTPVRKQLFAKANTPDLSEDDEEGEDKEASEESDEDEDEEGVEDGGEEVSGGLKKSPKQSQPRANSRTVTSTPTTTTTTKRKASETTPSSAVAIEKTATPAPKGKRRKIQDDNQEEEHVGNGKAADSEDEDVEAAGLKPSGQERTDRKLPGGRVREVEHVVARLHEETGQAESVVFHALVVASGDPALALLYLRGRQMWYQPWTPAEDKELQRSGARGGRGGGRVAARAKADVRARCAFLGVH